MRRRPPWSSPATSQFSGSRRRCGGDGRRHALGVRVIELFANRTELPLLELANGDAAPVVGRADDRRVHQLQHRPLAKGVRDDLRPAPLLEDEPLQEIRRPDDLPMGQNSPHGGERWCQSRTGEVNLRFPAIVLAPVLPPSDLG